MAKREIIQLDVGKFCEFDKNEMKIIYSRRRRAGRGGLLANDDEVWQIMKIEAKERRKSNAKGKQHFPPWQTKFQVIKIQTKFIKVVWKGAVSCPEEEARRTLDGSLDWLLA